MINKFKQKEKKIKKIIFFPVSGNNYTMCLNVIVSRKNISLQEQIVTLKNIKKNIL